MQKPALGRVQKINGSIFVATDVVLTRLNLLRAGFERGF
jgi:hypothetical protein